MTEDLCSANVRTSPERKTRRRWIQLDILIVVLFILVWIVLMAYRRADSASSPENRADISRLHEPSDV